MPYLPLTQVLLFPKQKKKSQFFREIYIDSWCKHSNKDKSTETFDFLVLFFSLSFWPPLIWDSISGSQVRAREVMLREGAVGRYMILAVLKVKFANLPQICELSLTFRGTLNTSPWKMLVELVKTLLAYMSETSVALTSVYLSHALIQHPNLFILLSS